MSVHAPAADQQSLTLPDWRTAIKRRAKRAPKPDGFLSALYFFFVMNVITAVLELVTGMLFLGALAVIKACCLWVMIQRRRADRTDPWPWLSEPYRVPFAVFVGAAILGDVTNG